MHFANGYLPIQRLGLQALRKLRYVSLDWAAEFHFHPVREIKLFEGKKDKRPRDTNQYAPSVGWILL